MPTRKVGRPPLSSNGSSQSTAAESPEAVAGASEVAAEVPTVDLDAANALAEATDAEVDVDLTASPAAEAGSEEPGGEEAEPKRGGLLGRLFSRKR